MVEQVLTDEAVDFLTRLQREFGPRRDELLAARQARAQRLRDGELPDFLPETAHVREGDWRVEPVPAELQDRRVEITGPVDRKMVINALNSGAKQYRLNDDIATLLVRPRGWHLDERHFSVDGAPISASLFDFGLYFFRNHARGGTWFYLPKLESHLEARLWNDVFVWAQDELGVPRGTIKATVLIETILAAFEMDEILYELREHSAGLNAGRWDYIFSIIKKLGVVDGDILPDRAQVTMAVPFMRAYAQQLVRACHRHGAHAIGGMAAFIPSRRDAEVNKVALERVREDKEREAGDGFDGTWVAHPDLVPVATEIFDRVLGDRPNQKDRQREDVPVEGAGLLGLAIPGGAITEAGLRNNVAVGL